MTSPAVSVVMPTYQRSAFLADAIDSALAQTFGDFELIVTDNGMSAEVEELVSSYGDPRIRYRHNGRNIGPLHNVLAAQREARAELFTLLHDDNLWEPTYLERLVRPLLEDASLAVAFCDHSVMHASGEVDLPLSEETTRRWGREGLRGGVHRPFCRLAIVEQAVSMAVAAVWRRSAFAWDEMPAEVELVYDVWFSYLISRGGGAAFYVPEQLMRYRLHEGSLSSNNRLNAALLAAYGLMLDDAALEDVRPLLVGKLAELRTGVGIDLLRSREPEAARVQLRCALQQRRTPRALVAYALTHLPAGAQVAERVHRPHRSSRQGSAATQQAVEG